MTIMKTELRDKPKLTELQLQKCKDYLQGKIENNGMIILMQTYINDVIALFGWQGVRALDEDLLIAGFCNFVTHPIAIKDWEGEVVPFKSEKEFINFVKDQALKSENLDTDRYMPKTLCDAYEFVDLYTDSELIRNFKL